MGILDDIEAAKSHTNINKKNAGTAGTRVTKSTLNIRKQKKSHGSTSTKFAGTKPAPQTAPADFGTKNLTDALDAFMSAAAILKRYDVTCRYIDDPEEARKVVKKLMTVKTTIGVDIETAKNIDYQDHNRAGLDPTLSSPRLVQLYPGGDTVYVIDVRACGFEVLTPLLERKRFVAHNAVFEMKHFLHADIDVRNFECSMLMGNALCGRHHKLSHLVETCLDINMLKEQQVSDWSKKTLTEDQILYAAADAVLVFELYCFLRQLVWEKYRGNIYLLMRDAQKAVARLVLNGIFFDTAAHDQLITGWKTKADAAYIEVKNLLGETVNPNSGKQLSNWLKANLDEDSLSLLPLTPTGQIKTTMDALSKLGDHPLIRPLTEYKKYKKLISSFGKSYSKFVNPVTGRMHGDFSLAGTITGRFSCYKPNVQNPPRGSEFRSLFKATPGYTIIVADYSQMQLRIAALLSGDWRMLQAYDEGIDLHQLTAAAIAGVPLKSVTKDQRQMAKAANFGLLFGQGFKGFRAKTQVDYGIAMTDREAQLTRNAFFENYLGLKQWQKTTARIAQQEKRVTTISGRVRDFNREKKKSHYNDSLNTPVQGAEAEVILAVLALLDEYMAGIDARLINIVHDEFVFEVAETDVDRALVAIEDVMVAGMLELFPDASTKNLVDDHAGDNWADAK